MGGTEIRIASSDADYAAFGNLIIQYVDWTRTRYHDDRWFVDEVFSHQSLDTEIQNLQQTYGAPQGKTLLAIRDGRICGVGAHRNLGDGASEMKRLFVAEGSHGLGIGNALCVALTESARADGFKCMRLDTARRLTEAIGLYERHGFKQCEPYRCYPPKLMPYLIFMELDLVGVT